jgi:alpha-D-ribose 1-methylphosphonate 5-triphosphate diphosphatase
MRRHILKTSIEAIKLAQKEKLLRADHMLHLRCEICDPAVLDLFEPYADDPLVQLVSIMDHTPGQRQWSDLEKYRQYHREKKWTDQEFEQNIIERKGLQRTYAERHRSQILAICREQQIPLASHDDTTEAHSIESANDGIAISEFPTTREAACKAKELKLHVIVGAPNLVRGNSHSGNVSAMELAEYGVLDGLSSDYYPLSLLHSAFILHQKLGVSLPDAVANVSSNIADLLNLEDRGSISPGKRADIIRVKLCDDLPVVRMMWRDGERIS